MSSKWQNQSRLVRVRNHTFHFYEASSFYSSASSFSSVEEPTVHQFEHYVSGSAYWLQQIRPRKDATRKTRDPDLRVTMSELILRLSYN